MNELYEIDDLIAKVLADEATADEQQTVEAWLDVSPDNRKYFEDLKRIWFESGDAVETLTVDTDAAWQKVRQRIHEPPVVQMPKKLTVKWLSTANIMKIAAAVLVLFGAIQFFNKGDAVLKDKEIVAMAAVLQDTLSDGSKVSLNKKSSLSTVFSKKERRVKLAGEAFFDVAHDTEKPFVIEVKTLEIKVVGTSFNVDNLSEVGKVVVVVETGKVLLRGANGAEIYLEKGEKAIYDVATGQFEKAKNMDKNVTAYKTNRLDFDRTTLHDVVKQINMLFDAQIEIASPEIENCLINSTYQKGDDLESYFTDIIGESVNLRVEKTGDKIILRGAGFRE
ncbi:MAG: FecR domain-containing protein [Saprospiraceae bacterium]|nr:FecR domain-containing protein [Saprospiraceae bacterium]